MWQVNRYPYNPYSTVRIGSQLSCRRLRDAVRGFESGFCIRGVYTIYTPYAGSVSLSSPTVASECAR